MAADEAVAEEQRFLDQAFGRRDALLDELHRELRATAEGMDGTIGTVRARGLRRRIGELDHESGLVFGRVEELDGTVRHIGRVGLPSADEGTDPMVVDWRAPVARSFYTATPVEPEGLASRRHIRTRDRRVLDVDDEPLGSTPWDGHLVGEAALLRALSERRTGHMGTVAATLQREQDAIVRAGAQAPLVVQGGPGTGKTVVALHRVAYLLFTHPHLAQRGVLVIGPSARFLDYIGQVLPALGETQVVAATCAGLLPGVEVTRDEPPTLAEIKGRGVWQQGVTEYVDDLVPPPCDLRFVVDGQAHVIPRDLVGRAQLSARSGSRPYHSARQVCFDNLEETLVDAVVAQSEQLLAEMETGYEDVLAAVDAKLERADDRALPSGESSAAVDGVLSEADIEAVRERVAANASVAAALERWWPRRAPGPTLRAFLGSAEAIHRYVPSLSQSEVDAVQGEPDGWAHSDIALLDAVADLLGDPDTGPELLDVEFLADRARDRRDWVYGHVVVDEAQELSAMQWHMLLRRCPTRTFTVVGDIDQASAPHRHTTWDEALRPAFGDRWRKAELTICYRTPSEVMELTEEVLRNAGSPNRPPTPVRGTGVRPWSRTCPEESLEAFALECAQELRARHEGGTVAVVAPRHRVGGLRRALGGELSVLDPVGAKGLEFDAVLVVDPAGIASGRRGWNALYVALTRCTQELGLLHNADAEVQDAGNWWAQQGSNL